MRALVGFDPLLPWQPDESAKLRGKRYDYGLGELGRASDDDDFGEFGELALRQREEESDMEESCAGDPYGILEWLADGVAAADGKLPVVDVVRQAEAEGLPMEAIDEELKSPEFRARFVVTADGALAFRGLSQWVA